MISRNHGVCSLTLPYRFPIEIFGRFQSRDDSAGWKPPLRSGGFQPPSFKCSGIRQNSCSTTPRNSWRIPLQLMAQQYPKFISECLKRVPLDYRQMALTLTPLGVTAGSPWRQPWGWESLIIRSPSGATDFACGKTGQTALPPHPGLTVWGQTYPTAYAVGYLLPSLRD